MWVLSKGTILASFCVNSSISLSLSYIWLFSTPFGLVKMDPPMEAERTNGETLIWVQSLKGYGQATLKSAKSFMHFDGDYRQLKYFFPSGACPEEDLQQGNQEGNKEGAAQS